MAHFYSLVLLSLSQSDDQKSERRLTRIVLFFFLKCTVKIFLHFSVQALSSSSPFLLELWFVKTRPNLATHPTVYAESVRPLCYYKWLCVLKPDIDLPKAHELV